MYNIKTKKQKVFYKIKFYREHEYLEKEDVCKMEWISVKDKLPDIIVDGGSDEVLIAVRYSYDEPTDPYTICCGYFLNGNWWSYAEHYCNKIGHCTTDLNFNSHEGDKVDYWMPLPENPQPCR